MFTSCKGIVWYVQVLLLIELCVAQNEDPPSLEDPFPADPGPEQPPVTPPPYTGCPAECAAKLDQAIQTISSLQKKLEDLEVTVHSKLDATDGSAATIPERLSKVETYLFENITGITNQLSTDLAVTSANFQQEISNTKGYIDSQIQAHSSSAGGSGVSEVYANITSRLDDLEQRKVQTLINENNVWRKNFEVVNKTFSKLRKSSYSNDVIVVG